jgi:hypothetical protein
MGEANKEAATGVDTVRLLRWEACIRGVMADIVMGMGMGITRSIIGVGVVVVEAAAIATR